MERVWMDGCGGGITSTVDVGDSSGGLYDTRTNGQQRRGVIRI